MITAKCNRCLGSAIGSTFTEASAKINHAVGLSRGIKCGDNYNKVIEIKDKSTPPKKSQDTLPPESLQKVTSIDETKKSKKTNKNF